MHILYVLLSALLSLIFTRSVAIPTEEYNTLRDLYFSTRGDFWTWKSEAEAGPIWDFQSNGSYTDPCSTDGAVWQGLTCTDAVTICQNQSCSISGINLSMYNLSVAILKHLTSLDLTSNSLVGTIPPELGLLSELKALSFFDNSFTGEFPRGLLCPQSPGQLHAINVDLNGIESIADCPTPVENTSYPLTAIFFAFNKIDGPLPWNFFTTLSALQYFDVSFNEITGSLPSSVGTLSNLIYFDISINYLYGTFPYGFQNAEDLRKLYLEVNSISGTIPSLIGTLNSLESFYFGHNLITGTLPPELSHASQLRYIVGENNMLTGSVPPAYGSLTFLTTMEFSENMLTSSLPPELGLLSNLRVLSMESNALTGVIPSNIGSTEFTQQIYLYNNYFTGKFPTLWGNFTALLWLDVSNNYLDGSIPETFTALSGLGRFSVASNALTGTLPDFLGHCKDLAVLDLSDNFFSGRLTKDMFSSENLIGIFLQNNMFSGPVPEPMSSFLANLFLFDNRFTSTLPGSLNKLYSLQTLLIQDNQLTGSLEDYFNRTYELSFDSLQVVDLSGNKYTGPLPNHMETLPRILYLALIGNCFTGTIPESFCEAKTLNTLLLDGLHAGSSCREYFWDPLHVLSGYIIDSGIVGGVPACLWESSQLKMLHLSGNKLTGSIPKTVNWASMVDLSLSYNLFTGELPNALKESNIVKMDLSRNRFSGTLVHSSSVNASSNYDKLYLSENRFSGGIPERYKSVRLIDILSGNIFRCESRRELPRADPVSDSYTCGSDAYDTPLEVWGIVWGFVFIAVVIIGVHTNRTTSAFIVDMYMEVLKWRKAAITLRLEHAPEVFRLLRILRDIRTLSCYTCACICTVYLFFYYFSKEYGDMGTHQYQFRWRFSAAYLSSQGAAASLLVLSFCLMYAVVYHIYRITRLCDSLHVVSCDTSSSAIRTKPLAVVTTRQVDAAAFKSYICVLAIVFIDMGVVLLVKGAFIIKTLDDSTTPTEKVLLQFGLSAFDIVWNSVVVTTAIIRTGDLLRPKVRVRLRFFLLLFNSLFAPVLATACTDRNCFVRAFTGNKDISTSSDVVYCSAKEIASPECYQYDSIHMSTSFVPPFTYNYQCASALITKFVPVFLFSYTFLSVLLPTVHYFQCVRSRNSSHRNEIGESCSLFVVDLFRRARDICPRPSYNPGVVMSDLLHYTIMLLTFGVVSPPLSVVICATISVAVYIFEMRIGKELLTCENSGICNRIDDSTSVSPIVSELATSSKYSPSDIGNLYGNIETKYRGVWMGPLKSIWIVVDVCCLFYATLCFDMSGDRTGWVHALFTAVLPMVAIPVVLRIIFRHKKIMSYFVACDLTKLVTKSNTEAVNRTSVELSTA